MLSVVVLEAWVVPEEARFFITVSAGREVVVVVSETPRLEETLPYWQWSREERVPSSM